jgi:hypothetical protein
MKNIFLEDVSYGLYDRPGPTGKVADLDKEQEDTVPNSAPVMAVNQMATQLSVERPPIEDEDYFPVNIEELSRASSAIARMVPVGQIKYFYKRLHELLDDATDQTVKTQEDTEPEKNEKITRKIKTVLKEMLSDEDKDEFEEFRTGQKVDYFGDTEPDDKKPGMGLEDIATKFGYSSASGARQEIKKITDRLQYFVTKVKPEDLDGLAKYASGEYVDTLLKGGLIDREDADDLLKVPHTWFQNELPSFGFFFVSAFVLPAYREVVRDATKNLKQKIQDLDIPAELHQTVFNQITGAASRKPEVIVSKLEKLIKTKQIDPREAGDIARKIADARPDLANSLEYSDDFVQRALEKWQRSPKGARIKAVKQALDNTTEE